MNISRLAAVLVVAAGIALGLYFLIDDTPATWMVRLSWAGALTAGLAAVLYAAVRASGET